MRRETTLIFMNKLEKESMTQDRNTSKLVCETDSRSDLSPHYMHLSMEWRVERGVYNRNSQSFNAVGATTAVSVFDCEVKAYSTYLRL